MAGLKLAKDEHHFDRWSVGVAIALLVGVAVVAFAIAEMVFGGGHAARKHGGGAGGGAGSGGSSPPATASSPRSLARDELIADDAARMPLVTDLGSDAVRLLLRWAARPAGTVGVSSLQLRVRVSEVWARCRRTDGGFTPWQPRLVASIEDAGLAPPPPIATTVQSAILRERLQQVFSEVDQYPRRWPILPRYRYQIARAGNFGSTSDLGMSDAIGAYLFNRAATMRCGGGGALLADRIPDQVRLYAYRYELMPADFLAHA